MRYHTRRRTNGRLAIQYLARCCACKSPLSRKDGYCRVRSCGLFMAEADEIRRLTWNNLRWKFYNPVREIRLTAHLLTAARIARVFNR